MSDVQQVAAAAGSRSAAAHAADAPDQLNEPSNNNTTTSLFPPPSSSPLTDPSLSSTIAGSSPPPSQLPFLLSSLQSSLPLPATTPSSDILPLLLNAQLVEVEAGAHLLEQGAPLSRTPLYIIQEGRLGVEIKKKSDKEAVRVGSVKPGDVVGIMSLYATGESGSSIVVDQHVRAWKLERTQVQQWIKSNPSLSSALSQRAWLSSVLSKNYLFRHLDDPIQKAVLLSRFEPRHAHQNEAIISYGEEGDRFYILEKGRCAIEIPRTTVVEEQNSTTTSSTTSSTISSTTSSPAPSPSTSSSSSSSSPSPASSSSSPRKSISTPFTVAEKGPGDSFGEIALLYSVPRCATVRCTTPECHLWSVDGAAFLRCATKGSRYLKHAFFEHASISDPITGDRLMNQADFFKCIKATKWRERKKNDGKEGANNLSEQSLRLMFRLADQSGDSLISFSEFVLLYGLLQAPFTKYQMAFRMFDKDKNGLIDRDEFIQVIKSLSDDRGQQLDISHERFLVDLFGDPSSPNLSKSITYGQFESLLQRDVLPQFLKQVQTSLDEMDEWTSQVDLALSQSSDGSGSALSGSSSAHWPGWRSLLAGGIAGAVSRTIVSPLERLKLLFQMQGVPPRYVGILQGLRLIRKEDGIKGFFRGNLSNVIRITPASAFQFYFYDLYKRLFWGPQAEITPWQRLGAGGLAGMTACLLTYPLDFIRARLTLQSGSSVQYRGIFHGLSCVIRTQGIRGWYVGLWPSLAGIFPYIGIDFAVYETLRNHLPPQYKNAKGDHNRVALLCCGATAGVVGQTVAYPLDLIRRRLQVQGFGNTTYHYSGGIFSTMKQIIKEEGIKGLYKGMGPNYAKVVPAVSISFVVYEQCRRMLDEKK